MILLTEIQYHPPVQYFQLVKLADDVLIEQHENYCKQSYRNRCRILTAGGTKDLSVPVKKGNRKIRITELEIDYEQKWLTDHWRSIQSAYGRSAYFEHYAPFFRQVYDQKPRYLFDLNLALLKLYFKFLRLPQTLSFTDAYQAGYGPEIGDQRNSIHPKTEPDNLVIKNYYQVFGKQFAPNLSIIDLLFTQGPDAAFYL